MAVCQLSAQKISLTDAERAWIEAHPIITFGGEPAWEPYLVDNGDGTYSGLDIDIIQRIEVLTGLHIEVVGGPWQEMVTRAQERQIDGLITSTPRPARRQYFNFTDDYATANVLMYSRVSDTTTFERLKDFDGRKLGLQSGNQINHDLLSDFEQPNVTDYPDIESLVEALLSEEVDYVMSGGELTYYLSRYGLSGAKTAYVIREANVPLVYSIRKDWPELITIINKALAEITTEERNQLLGKWLLDLMTSQEVFTPAAQRWLDEHDTITFGLLNDWAPLSEGGSDVAEGLIPSYYQTLNGFLHLTLEFEFYDQRAELTQALSANEVDAIAVGAQDSLKGTLAFHSFPLALASKHLPYTLDLSSLHDLKIGISARSPLADGIRARYPNLQFEEVERLDMGLLMIENDELDGFIGGLPLISLQIRRMGLSELKIAGVLPMRMNLRAYANDPMLVEVLNEAQALVPAGTVGDLAGSWYEEQPRNELIDFQWFWRVVGGFALLLTVVFVWNRSLAGQIQKRKRIEQSLRSNRANLRAMIENSKALICSFDPDYRLIALNNNFAHFTEQFNEKRPRIGDALDDFLPQALAERWKRRLTRALEGETYSRNYSIQGATTRYFEVSFSPIVNSEVVEGVSCHALEVTELTELSRNFVNVLEHMTDYVYLKDTNLRYVAASQSFAKLQGFKSWRELVGKTDLDVYTPELATRYEQFEQQIMETGEGQFHVEEAYTNQLGEEYWISNSTQPIRNADGETIGLLGVSYDFTARRKMEDELRKARDAAEQANDLKGQYIKELKTKQNELLVLNWFADSAPIGLGMADLESDTIVFINPALMRLVGETTESNIIGRNIRDYLEESERIVFDQEIKPAIDRHGFWKGERKMKSKKGNTVYTYEHYFLLRDEDGNPIALANVVTDITERRRMEADLRERRKEADRANRAKSAFLANMSHEIRTPLNSIIGFSDLLNQMVTDELHHSYLQAISASGKTLLALINDVLDISKIESGKFEIRQVPLNLKVLAEEVRSMFTIKAREKNLEFQVEVDNPISEYLLLDELRIKQILINLLGNSFKFTHQGGVFLRIRVTEGEERSYHLEFEVEDTGIGIAPTAKDKIFHNFYQDLDRPGTGAIGGTGLGLAIVQKLVKLMGGQIEMESEVDKGTTFRLQFPRTKIIEDTTTIKEDLREGGNEQLMFETSSVLLVDDIDNNRFYLRELFRNTPILVWEARDGVEALEIIGSESIDLILTDVRMPRMDGFQLVRELRNSEITASIPIVAVTASVFGADSKLKDLFDAILYKPVLQADLFHLLKRYIPHHTAEDEVGPRKPTVQELVIGPSLKVKVKEELWPQFEELRAHQPIGKVLEFAHRLQAFEGGNGEGKVLRDFGRRLESTVNNLDIAGMLDQLRAFERMLELAENNE